jgi:hypothetical protein
MNWSDALSLAGILVQAVVVFSLICGLHKLDQRVAWLEWELYHNGGGDDDGEPLPVPVKLESVPGRRAA